MSPERELTRETAPIHSGVRKTDVVVIGLGYVGLPLAVRAAHRGLRTVGFDIDDVKVAQLIRREAAFLSPDEQADLREATELEITSDVDDIVRASAYIICVPTPVHDDHLPDLRPLSGAAAIVGRAMRRGSLVVVESTVNPGACEDVVRPILMRESGLARHEFGFAHCPERINPGDARWNVSNIPRVVGGQDEQSLERALALYQEIVAAELVPMRTIKEAEAVKMVENAFRDINIAFVNELAMSFDKAGIDVVHVIDAAATKPFGFMAHYPGCGVGGHCIPVDPYYLIRYARKNGFEHHFLKTARRVNNGMPFFTVRVLADELRGARMKLRGSTIAVLGLSYKADVGDVRESPALEIREILRAQGADVRAFDPLVRHESDVHTLDAALDGADAVVVATAHESFRSLTPHVFEQHGVRVVVDGRNCLDADAFKESRLSYRGIGR